MTNASRLLAVGFCFVLSLGVFTACSGGSSAVGTLPARGTPRLQHVALQIIVPAAQATMSAKLRHAMYVSMSTQGLMVTVYAHGTTSPIIASQAIDISATAPASSQCTSSATQRTCVPSIAVPAGGPYDFSFATYDASPIAGSFAAAKQVGAGVSPNITIAVGIANTVAISIGGVVASAFITPSVPSFSGLYNLTENVVVGARDADGHIILTSGPGETYV
ncbi:MAG: hypothetical protein ACYDA1_10960, partial [Vulcanimicrobiaceae bacterium]